MRSCFFANIPNCWVENDFEINLGVIGDQEVTLSFFRLLKFLFGQNEDHADETFSNFVKPSKKTYNNINDMLVNSEDDFMPTKKFEAVKLSNY